MSQDRVPGGQQEGFSAASFVEPHQVKLLRAQLDLQEHAISELRNHVRVLEDILKRHNIKLPYFIRG